MISKQLPFILLKLLKKHWIRDLALVTHTYIIHTFIYTVYIPILYLFYTRILYFFTVLYLNKNVYMIQPPVLHAPCFYATLLFA